jgi:hypothetical protein
MLWIIDWRCQFRYTDIKTQKLANKNFRFSKSYFHQDFGRYSFDWLGSFYWTRTLSPQNKISLFVLQFTFLGVDSTDSRIYPPVHFDLKFSYYNYNTQIFLLDSRWFILKDASNVEDFVGAGLVMVDFKIIGKLFSEHKTAQ